ncbi:MAG TPA: pyrroline-5-carboxylate reductase [Acidimicrobiia bacterium]|nr:pyrroline-5-carboxylate reductase [Acidimicrobiia bacterium]
MKILIVGGGSMGQAFSRGILSSENEHICFVIERELVNQSACRNLGAVVYSTVTELEENESVEDFDACIVAVKPNDIEGMSSELNSHLPDTSLIISIAAGVTIASLQSYFKGFPVVRAMPNIAASQLLSATAMCVADGMRENDLYTANTILELLGTVVQVQENQMDLVTALSGSGPAYFFLLAELLIEAAKDRGMSAETAHQLVNQTFMGAATMAMEDGSIACLREKVTSPGGTTQAALNVFEENNLDDLIHKALDAAVARSVELRGK